MRRMTQNGKNGKSNSISGLFLQEPHPSFIQLGVKTLIIKSREFPDALDKELILLGDKAYGMIKLTKMKQISLVEFKNLRESHRIAEEERVEWGRKYKEEGWLKGPLFAYEFEFEPFDKTRDYVRPKGLQIFLSDVVMKEVEFEIPDGFNAEEYLSKLDLQDLIMKPTGPWGEGFPECEAWVKRNRPGVRNPKAYCGAIHQLQRKKAEKADLLQKPKGPWGEGFPKCEAWIKRNRPEVRDPRAYCAAIYQTQQEKRKAESGDLLWKPTGPWGEGFPECIAWVKRNKPEVKDPQAYCGAIHQVQEGKRKPHTRKAELPESLEDVDSKFVADLTDKELIEIDKKLHAIFEKRGKVNEPLLNAHVFLWREMKERKIKHTIDDKLTEETRFWIQEYPSPVQKMLKLEDVLEAFPDRIALSRPDLELFLCGGLINRGWITGHDIDLRIASDERYPEIEREILHQLNNNQVREKIGFIWDAQGGIGHSLRLYDQSLKKAGVQLFRPTQPMKPATGVEYTDEADLYNRWVAPRLGKGVLIQPKWDGMCQPPGSLIFANPEIKTIETVNVGDKLLNGTEVKRIWKRPYSGKLYGFRIRGLDLQFFTPEHPIWVRKRKVKRQATMERSLLPARFIPASEISKRDAVFISKLKPDYSDIEIEKAELFGWLMAEGSWNIRWGNISIALSENEIEEADRIHYLFKQFFDKSLTKRVRSGGIELYGRSKSIAKYLSSLFDIGARNKRIPNIIMKSNKVVTETFMRAWIDGDGNRTGNQTLLTTSSKKAAYQGFMLLTRLGILASLYEIKRPSGKIKGRPVHERTAWIIQWRKPSKFSHYSITEDGFWTPITEVTSEEYDGQVHNFETNTATYQVPFLVHNSFQIHIAPNRVGIFTEDQLRDRAKAFKESVNDFKKIKAKSAILAVEMVEYSEDELGGRGRNEFWEKYRQIPREDLIKWIAAKPAGLDDSRIVFHIHDLLSYNGKSMLGLGYQDRFYALKRIVPKTKHLHVSDTWGVSSKSSFESALQKARAYPNSEGAMLKASDAKYKISTARAQRTREFAKIKNLKSIDVMVFDPHAVKDAPGNFTYQGYVGPLTDKQKREPWREQDRKEWKGEIYLRIGTTYNIKAKLAPGSILEIRPVRIELQEKDDKRWATWMFPKVGIPRPGKKDPDSLDFAIKLAKVGTAPLQKSPVVVRLRSCPYLEKEEICPLFHKIKIVKAEGKLLVERLKYPIKACRLAYFYRCGLVKPYYYEMVETK